MNHVAIDLGSSKSQVCARDGSGAIIEEKPVPTGRLPSYLKRLPHSRVIIETSAEAFFIADAAMDAGHEVRVVPATLSRSLGVGQRGVKNDERDARVLSEVSARIDLPSVHIPSAKAREWRALCGSRERLVATRTMLVNRVRGWMRTHAVTLRGRSTTTFADRLRAHELSADGLPIHIERLLVAIESTTTLLADMDRELKQLVREDELLQRLTSVPGVGPVTAVRFVAVIDDVSRFHTAHALQSYLGLTPGERSSGMKVRHTGITKAGCPGLRALLVQAAWAAQLSRTHKHDPMVVWTRKLAERKGKLKASTALARRLAGILFAIWRDGTRYDAAKGAAKTTG